MAETARMIAPALTKSMLKREIILKIPKMPILMMTPDITPEMWAGAAGWAYGSQVWKGTKPALTAKPAKRSRKAVIPSVCAQ